MSRRKAPNLPASTFLSRLAPPCSPRPIKCLKLFSSYCNKPRSSHEMNTKVLFISHDAQPHGAQILLLHLVRWIAAQTRIIPHVLLKRDGPMRKDFEAVAPTTLLSQADHGALLPKFRREHYDILYSHPITNCELLDTLAPLARSVLTHLPELGYWITYRSRALD